MIKIKVSIPGFSKKINISQFIGSYKNTAFDCIFFVNDDTVKKVDYWFVIDDLNVCQDEVVVSQSNIYYLTAEVMYGRGYFDDPKLKLFLSQFGKIYTCHDIYNNNTIYDIPFLPWMINSNHGSSIFDSSNRDIDWLAKYNIMPKSALLSVFCSDKQSNQEHKLRYKFVCAVKEHFKERLHWYGNGINTLAEKWYGIAPYKYHIVLENQSRNKVITEKLYDCYLGNSFPIYYGAPDVSKYFRDESLAVIDIIDINGSIETIEHLINSNIYESRLPFILESKRKVLFELNLFKRLSEIAKKNQISGFCFSDSQLIRNQRHFKLKISKNTFFTDLYYIYKKVLSRALINLK